MIKLEKIEWEKCSPLKENLPLHHTSTPFFLIFQIPPPPGEVFTCSDSAICSKLTRKTLERRK